MKNYCSSCYRLQEIEMKRCPKCRKKLCEPTEGDPVFLIKRAEPWSGMISALLKDNDIPFNTLESEETGIGAILGYVHIALSFYVPYSLYEKAKALCDELLEGEDTGEGWIDEENDAESENEENGEND